MENFKGNGKTAFKYRLTVMSALCLLLSLPPVAIIAAAHKVAAFAPLLYIISGIMLALIITFTVVNACLSHKIFCYKVDAKGVEIVRGFIFKKDIFTPKHKIRAVKILPKKYIFKNLCDIVFVNDAYDVEIKNVTNEEAEQIIKENFGGVFLNERI